MKDFEKMVLTLSVVQTIVMALTASVVIVHLTALVDEIYISKTLGRQLWNKVDAHLKHMHTDCSK
jgi:hypothetical protein